MLSDYEKGKNKWSDHKNNEKALEKLLLCRIYYDGKPKKKKKEIPQKNRIK